MNMPVAIWQEMALNLATSLSVLQTHKNARLRYFPLLFRSVISSSSIKGFLTKSSREKTTAEGPFPQTCDGVGDDD